MQPSPGQRGGCLCHYGNAGSAFSAKIQLRSWRVELDCPVSLKGVGGLVLLFCVLDCVNGERNSCFFFCKLGIFGHCTVNRCFLVGGGGVVRAVAS